MIDVKEHIYDDDPKQGHPDARTRLKDTSYFFLGNGLIQAAIQIAPAKEGSPVGLIIMNPEKLGKKRETLTFDLETGFEHTMLGLNLINEQKEFRPQNPIAEWYDRYDFPAVKVQWSTDFVQINEIFYCPDRSNAKLIREIYIKNLANGSIDLELRTGVPSNTIRKRIALSSKQEKKIVLNYQIQPGNKVVAIDVINEAAPAEEALLYWKKSASISFQYPLLDHYYNASRFQLPAVISRAGVVDASIWQYNREWVRDHSFMAIGLILSGHHEIAATLLNRLLKDFVSDEGDCVDSSEKRDPEDVELDQNGTLLYALNNYVLWTGDLELISQNWEKIRKVADFPLQKIFRHKPSGMFCNCREYWERHQAHGIEEGIELLYQVFPSIGLSCAAILARLLSKEDDANHWEVKAQRLKNAILNRPEYAMVDHRGFIKRRNADGSVQETITPRKDSGLPAGVPLAADIEHLLHPDTATALPIALGFIPPDSPIAKLTLEHLELLWNQGWEDGGYGRYHLSSEADSAGAWPFPSLFVARAYLEMGEFEKVWRILNWLNTIPGAKSGSWFEMYGPRISPPFAQVGITPWTWGEMIVLLIHHIIGIQPQENYIRFRPKLLPGVEKVEGRLPLRKNWINLDLKVDPGKSALDIKTNVPVIESNELEILIPYSNEDIFIEGLVPDIKLKTNRFYSQQMMESV